MRSVLSFLIILLAFSPSFSGAAENPFKTKNPDIDKYSFTKNFIIGLGYYDRAAERMKEEAGLSEAAISELATIQTFIDNRTLDNTELRIARNYLTRFASSRNGLVRKITEDVTAAYDRLIAISIEERGLWQAFYDFKKNNIDQRIDDQDFIRQQTEIALDKKEIAKELLVSSQLIRVLLLSAQKCSGEDCRHLAITQKEREKLLERLNVFAGDRLSWGMKAGQSTIEACVAAIREVLEDPIYISK